MAKKRAAAAVQQPKKDTEIYKVRRPRTLAGIVGQKPVVRLLQSMLDRGEVPHYMTFAGPTGTGKTTMARILARELGCRLNSLDFHEVNFADTRGIDSARKLEDEMKNVPMMGGSSVWILDEFHMATKEAFQSLNKTLESMPPYAYVFACTMDPNKVLRSIRTRGPELSLTAMRDGDLTVLLEREAPVAGIELTGEALDKIVESSEGSARAALQFLEMMKSVKQGTAEEQMELIQPLECKGAIIDLVRALGSKNWGTIVKHIKSLPEKPDSEGIRRTALAYYSHLALKGDVFGFKVLKAFRENTYDCGMAGIILACKEAIS